MMPEVPVPVVITLPVVAATVSTTVRNEVSSWSTSPARARASRETTSRAAARSVSAGTVCCAPLMFVT